MTEIPSTNAIFVPTIMIIMKKRILSLLLLIQVVVCVQAQTKSQVISDAIYTMEDFTSDLNFINDEKGTGMDGISSMSHTFASAEYFMYNGKKMESFQKWLEEYCFQGLAGQHVEHSIDILQKTFEKVDEDEKNDKRYRFDALLTRRSDNSVNDEKTVTFIVEWKGNSQYVSILEIKGHLGDFFKEKPINGVTSTKGETNEFRQWYREHNVAIFFIISVLGFLLGFICFHYEITGWQPLALMMGGVILPFIINWFIIPTELFKNVRSKYTAVYENDSLFVATVCKDNKWGLIDYDEVELFPIQNEAVGTYSEYKTWFKKDGRYGFIDRTGRVIIENKYSWVSFFRQGKAIVIDKTIHMINESGNKIKELPYTNIEKHGNFFFKVWVGKKIGFISLKDFTEVVPPVYQDGQAYNEIIYLKKNNKWGIVDKEGNNIQDFTSDFVRIINNGDTITLK